MSLATAASCGFSREGANHERSVRRHETKTSAVLVLVQGKGAGTTSYQVIS
jgi:hypothetical protein